MRPPDICRCRWGLPSKGAEDQGPRPPLAGQPCLSGATSKLQSSKIFPAKRCTTRTGATYTLAQVLTGFASLLGE